MPPRFTKHDVFRTSRHGLLRETLMLLTGGLLSAVAVNVFYLPIKLTMGGISGVAAIIFQLTGKGTFLSFGILVFLLNIPLLILGWRKIDLRFVWRSLIGTSVY